MKKLSFYLIVIVFWTVIAALVVEAVFLIVRPEPRYATWLELHDRGFMQNRANFSTSHRGYGREVRYTLGPQRTRLAGEVPRDGQRVLVLGDSFTFGLHVSDENTITSLLNERFVAALGQSGAVESDRAENTKLSGVHAASAGEIANSPYFINAAVGGTGLADHLAHLQTYGDVYAPEAVVVVLSIDDLARAVAKNLYVVEEGQLVASKRWEESQVKRFMERIPGYFYLSEHSAAFNAVVTYLWSAFYFTDLTRGFDATSGYAIPPSHYLQHDDAGDSQEPPYLSELVRLLFAEMKAWADVRDIPLIVFSNGYYLAAENAYTHYLMAIMPEIAAGLGIPYYDAGPALQAAVDGDFSTIQIAGEWHPDETGNRLLADLVYPWLLGVFTR